MRTARQLADLVVRHIPAPGMLPTALPRLSLFRADAPTAPLPAVYEASLCLIAQGAKRVALGDRVAMFDAAHHLLVSIELPLTGHVTTASPDAPYLCCKLDLDLATLADLALAQGAPGGAASDPALTVSASDPELIDAACRLVGLLGRPPAEAALLAPIAEREILGRLLLGPQGGAMRRLALADSHLARVARAAAHIRGSLDTPLRIAQLAAVAGMSASSFHQHFKAVTRLTPIEYQKQLRLQEAHRLMATQGVGAAGAGFAVGYESPSQFSRDYARLFGQPPARHIARQRAGVAAIAA